MKTKDLKFSVEEYSEIIKNYGGFPECPDGYEFTGRLVGNDEAMKSIWLSPNGSPLVLSAPSVRAFDAGKRLELNKKEPKYIYKTDGVAKLPARGTFIAYPRTMGYSAVAFEEVDHNWADNPMNYVLVFTREEVIDSE